MPRKGIDSDTVAAAVAQLHAEHRPASPVLVRLVTGTGSYTTICRTLRSLGVNESKRPRANRASAGTHRTAGRMRR